MDNKANKEFKILEAKKKIKNRYSIERFPEEEKYILGAIGISIETLDEKSRGILYHTLRDVLKEIGDIPIGIKKGCFRGRIDEGCWKYQNCEIKDLHESDRNGLNFNCWAGKKKRMCKNKNEKIWKYQFDNGKNTNPYSISPKPHLKEQFGGCGDCNLRQDCRDSKPCPYLGCVTPSIIEENFNLNWLPKNVSKLDNEGLKALIKDRLEELSKPEDNETNEKKKSNMFLLDTLCPYTYRYTLPDPIPSLTYKSDKFPNQMRFLQCYITSREFVDEVLHDILNIYGIGVLFIDPRKGRKGIYHIQKNASSDMKPYLELPYFIIKSVEGKETWKETENDFFITTLFQILRQRPTITAKGRLYPEVFYVLNEDKKYRLNEFERLNDLLFCTDGELSTFIFTWRLLKWNEACDKQEIKIDDWMELTKKQKKYIDLNNTMTPEEEFILCEKENKLIMLQFKQELKETGICNLKELTIQEHIELPLKRRIGPFKRTLKEELKVLGFIEEPVDNSKEYKVTKRFCRMIIWVTDLCRKALKYRLNSYNVKRFYTERNEKEEEYWLDFEKLKLEEEEILKLSDRYKKYLQNGTEAITKDKFKKDLKIIKEILLSGFKEEEFNKKINKINQIARFPILPYYVWRANEIFSMAHIGFSLSPRTVKDTEDKDKEVVFFVGSVKDESEKITLEGIQEDMKPLLLQNKDFFLTMLLPLINNILYDKIIYEEISSYAKRVAAVTIIIDAFAHNVAAHCLSALVLYLEEKRKKLTDSTEIYRGQNSQKKKEIPCPTLDELKKLFQMPDIPDTPNFDGCKEYDAKFDDSYKKMFSLCVYLEREETSFVNFLIFMRAKSAFWAGAIGYQSPGGIIMNFYDIFTQFADNSLFLGTIAYSEEITGVAIKINNKAGAVSLLEQSTYRYEYNSITGNEEFLREKEWNDTFYKVNASYKPQKIHKELKKYNIFLPGGIVGLQALYTIWENILRNVKHTRTDYSIMPLKIEIKEDGNKYSITSYLDLEVDNAKEVVYGGEENGKHKLGIIDNIRKGIVDENGKPLMGGNTQVVICAGLIRSLSPVETHQKIKEEEQDLLKVFVEDKKIKYAVKVWKGDYYVKWKDIKNSIRDKSEENIYRFKIVVTENADDEKEIARLKRPPVRRIQMFANRLKNLEKGNTSKGNIDKKKVFRQLYEEWLAQWVYEDNLKFKFAAYGRIWQKKPKNIVKYEGDEYDEVFVHTDDQEVLKSSRNHIGVRSHGTFTELTREEKGNKLLAENLEELIEILATRITILDNRILNKFQNLHERQQKILSDTLNVKIFKEEQQRHKLLKVVKGTEKKQHFLVIHLSNIETAKENGKDIYKENLQEFVDEVVGTQSSPKLYRYLVFTSGRNRRVEKTGFDDYQKRRTFFVHLENFLRIFEWASQIPIEAAFRVKYGLVKCLVGT
ncbi:hypothetical protein KAW65_00365 [candidate division WOR-3 bacterium]|nr:hypothetical protein [candidate division WOR-3 bacterium]